MLFMKEESKEVTEMLNLPSCGPLKYSSSYEGQNEKKNI